MHLLVIQFTCRSVIICEIIVHLLVIVQNNKICTVQRMKIISVCCKSVFLVGKPEGKRPLGRPRRRWEDNIRMALQEMGGGCGDWMELAQDRDRCRALVSTVMNLRVPKVRGIS